MTINENAIVFYQLPVRDFQSKDDWQGTDTAYRLRSGWDGKPGDMVAFLDTLVKQEGAPKLTALVIGMWGTQSDVSSQTIIQALVQRKHRLGGLRALFLGDIIVEENEISWIQNSDVSSLLQSFPNLEVFRVRGGNGLSFSKAGHQTLRELIVETGGLPRSVIREICLGDFPNIEHLELWLGSANYGWDGTVQDLQPILEGKRFPKLKYLGLRNSEIVDEIAPVLVNSPILRELEVLDLSNGNLSDVGGQALLNLPKNTLLRE
ncbi:MAG TPA: STM4015 family protein, partial [Verrucomicrobiae bacterium]|nr:STM4015 family protein [Verrucomicrobiae bacterium]